MGKDLKGKELGQGLSQRKDGRYSARFASKSGKRVEKYFEKLVPAKRWLVDAKYEDEHGNIGSSTNMTMNIWFEYWINNIKSKTVRRNTLRNYNERYIHNIKECIGTMIISEIKPLHCQNIINIMDDKGYAGGTMEQAGITMYNVFASAEENAIIVSNPVTRTVKCPNKPKKAARVLNVEEQKLFLNAAKHTSNYGQYLFLLQTGMRTGEMIGLKWEDIDFEKRVVSVRRTMEFRYGDQTFSIGEPKSKAGYREIPITQTVFDLLRKIELERKSRKICVMEFAEFVFLNRNGMPTKNSTYDAHLVKLAKKAGIEKLSMHTLRHSFATRCIESGMKPKTLQKILGHSNIGITMDLYVHVTDDEKTTEMQKFEKMYKMA